MGSVQVQVALTLIGSVRKLPERDFDWEEARQVGGWGLLKGRGRSNEGLMGTCR